MWGNTPKLFNFQLKCVFPETNSCTSCKVFSSAEGGIMVQLLGKDFVFYGDFHNSVIGKFIKNAYI